MFIHKYAIAFLIVQINLLTYTYILALACYCYIKCLLVNLYHLKLKIYIFRYAAVRKSRDRGEASTAAPLVTIVVAYPGSYGGPVFNSEHFALALSALVFYLAFSSKSKLLA